MNNSRTHLQYYVAYLEKHACPEKEVILVLDKQFTILFLNKEAQKFLTLHDQKKISSNINPIDLGLYLFLSEYITNYPNQQNPIFFQNGQVTWKIEAQTYFDKWTFLLRSIDKKEDNRESTIHNLEVLIDNMPCNVYWMDTNCLMAGCNRNVLKMLKLSKQEFLGKSYEELSFLCGWPEGLAQKLKNDDLKVLQTHQPIFNVEDPPIPGSEDNYFHFLTNRVPLFNQEGKIIGVAGISTDISELIIAKKRAETANRAKTEFIANISHDIRTPLTGVIGLSQLMEQTLNNQDDKEKAHMLHDSGEELLHMLNEILDDVQAERLNEQDIKHESFDLYQCINDLIRLETPATSLKHLSLKASIPSDVPRYIRSDRNKIHRILLNLLGNAIKFTQSGSITLSIECLHQGENKVHLKFGVADTGIGIPEDVQSQVFNRFFKVSSSYKGIYTGHGLGLHIAQSYVTLLGGHITLTSKVGEGSTFHFDLECALGEAPLLSAEQSLNQLASSSKQLSPKNIHLLLVEDNLIVLKTLELMFSQKGYPFISARNGEEAFYLWQNNPVDLIITDIGLPGISGTELAQKIRAQEQILDKPPTSIIGLTGHTKEAAWDECQRVGMDEILSKPAQIELLEQYIQKMMSSRANTKQESSKETANASLGFDLPNTEEELFHLEVFPLFNEQKALEQIPDKNLLITLLNTFLSDEIQKDIVQMQAEYQQGNWNAVETIAHKIKGGAAYLGTQKMFYACQYLERYYKAGHRAMLEPLYRQIIRVNEETINALRKWLG